MFAKIVLLLVTLVVVFSQFSSAQSFGASSKLGQYNITDVTVSGLSSGGYMAVQVHVGFSSIVTSAAVFAGGPYYCAQGNLAYAEYKCMGTTLGEPKPSELVGLTNSFALSGKIDSPTNLKKSKLYLYSGTGDSVVDQSVVKALQTYYSYYLDNGNIVADYNVLSEHCLPTLSYGEPCATLKSPYIGKCGFDGAYNALHTLYGELNTGSAIDANLIAFDQTPYVKTKQNSIDSTGYVYVPQSCASGSACSLHISFHGCKQGLKAIGNDYAKNTGFNSWAEANNIIVLYPYVEPSSYNPSNPNGCWDWWAYTGRDYAEKTGKQMSFVKELISHVSNGKF